ALPISSLLRLYTLQIDARCLERRIGLQGQPQVNPGFFQLTQVFVGQASVVERPNIRRVQAKRSCQEADRGPIVAQTKQIVPLVVIGHGQARIEIYGLPVLRVRPSIAPLFGIDDSEIIVNLREELVHRQVAHEDTPADGYLWNFLLAYVLLVRNTGATLQCLDVDAAGSVVVPEEDVRRCRRRIDRQIQTFRKDEIESGDADAIAALELDDARRQEIARILALRSG